MLYSFTLSIAQNQQGKKDSHTSSLDYIIFKRQVQPIKVELEIHIQGEENIYKKDIGRVKITRPDFSISSNHLLLQPWSTFPSFFLPHLSCERPK
jgi:hypothetical protein